MNIIEFNEILEIRDEIVSDSVTDLGRLNKKPPFKLEYLNLEANSYQELYDMIKDNDSEINQNQVLLSIEYMLDESYFEQRFKGIKEVFLVVRKKDAIIIRNEMKNSKKIDCSDYNTYVDNIMESITK